MKRNKNILIVFGIMASLIVALWGCGSSSSDEVKAGKNQKLVNVMVSSINGNEMTYMEITESESSTTNTSSTSSSKETSTSTSNDTGGNSDSQAPPNMPEGESSFGNGEQPSMKSGEMESGNSKSNKSGKMNFGNMGEATTATIPVGTKVHTTTDTVTTFSRISAGSKLKLLMEKNSNNKYVIVEIWME